MYGDLEDANRNLEIFYNLSKGFTAGKFIIFARKKAHDPDMEKDPQFPKLVKHIDRYFYQDYHYLTTGIIEEKASKSKIEMVSKFSGSKNKEKIDITIQQYDALFDRFQII